MANKTMKMLVIGDNTYEIVDEAARNNIKILQFDVETLKQSSGSGSGSGSGISTIVIDDTLTQSGQAADAKVTGDKITEAKQIASNAQSIANSAQATASNAISSANTAQSMASNANAMATNAYAVANKAVKKTTMVVTLSAIDWTSENKITTECSGVTDDNTIIISPTPDSFEVYNENGIRCIEQSINALTFYCESIPTSDITVNVVILV